MASSCRRLLITSPPLSLLQHVTSMHRANSSQAPDFVWLAFQRGNYSKVLDIAAFNTRMKQSQQLAECQSELGHLLFLLRSRTYGESHRFLQDLVLTGQYPDASLGVAEDALDGVSSNQDYDVDVTWDFVPAAARRAEIATARRASLAHIQLRQQVLRLMLWVAEGNPSAAVDCAGRVEAKLKAMHWLPGDDADSRPWSTASVGVSAASMSNAPDALRHKAWALW